MSIHKVRQTRLICALFVSVTSYTAAAESIIDMHLDPDMEGREYLALWERLERSHTAPTIQTRDPLSDILKVGKRNLQWIDAINSHRPPESKLELSTPENQIAYPIDNPKESNREIVTANYNALKAVLPSEMSGVLFGTADLPFTVSLDDQTFLKYALDLDRVYQSASRWLLQEPALWQYSSMAQKDVRGYHFLAREANLTDKLTHWKEQSDEVRNKLSPWLVNMCTNSKISLSSCRQQLANAVNNGTNIKPFYDKYVVASRKLYNGFFAVQNPRPDAQYDTSSPNSFVLPFKKPERKDVENWLRDNIEDEWKFGDFQLSLDFSTQSSGAAYVTFEAGATPHVDGLGASHITMDANRNIQEYTSKWTIRHEFGHVIGFPDCYIEYYDSERKVMINYQIDTTNLMCSRRGHLQQQHLDALQKAYWSK